MAFFLRTKDDTIRRKCGLRLAYLAEVFFVASEQKASSFLSTTFSSRLWRLTLSVSYVDVLFSSYIAVEMSKLSAFFLSLGPTLFRSFLIPHFVVFNQWMLGRCSAHGFLSRRNSTKIGSWLAGSDGPAALEHGAQLSLRWVRG